jgi:hypothetical protein
MTSNVGSNPYSSVEALETTYQIGKFIHSHVTIEVGDKSGKPWSNYPGHFTSGPNPYYNQTKKGLVLEGYYGMPSKIHTPYGHWSILGSGSGDWDKVFEAIKEPLGLVLLKEGKQNSGGYVGPFWAITKWEDKEIEMPEYKKDDEYITYEKVKEVWKSFTPSHPELTQ